MTFALAPNGDGSYTALRVTDITPPPSSGPNYKLVEPGQNDPAAPQIDAGTYGAIQNGGSPEGTAGTSSIIVWWR